MISLIGFNLLQQIAINSGDYDSFIVITVFDFSESLFVSPSPFPHLPPTTTQ
jgi:hypothetical protein